MAADVCGQVMLSSPAFRRTAIYYLPPSHAAALQSKPLKEGFCSGCSSQKAFGVSTLLVLGDGPLEMPDVQLAADYPMHVVDAPAEAFVPCRNHTKRVRSRRPSRTWKQPRMDDP